MAVNKVIYYGEVLVDMSQVSVKPETLGKGETALDAAGELITGTMEAATDPVLQQKTVSPTTSAQTVTPDSGYDGLSKVTVNAMPTATQATPSISVSSSGLITASATQTAGYVAAGTKSATKQLTTQGAQTITPGTSNKTISSGRYLTGTQTIKGDSNLVAANIAKGKTIFGVTGTHEGGGGGGGGTSVGTCSVTIKSRGATLGNVTYTYLTNDGVIDTTKDSVVYASGETFECVCGTMMCFNMNGALVGSVTTENAELVNKMGSCAWVKITAPTGGTATINVIGAADS